MGMYTGLRFKADLSEKGLEAAASVIETRGWYVAAEMLPAIKSWLQVGRRNFIPFGAVCYMPADWENLLGIEDGVWSVCCSLKQRPNGARTRASVTANRQPRKRSARQQYLAINATERRFPNDITTSCGTYRGTANHSR